MDDELEEPERIILDQFGRTPANSQLSENSDDEDLTDYVEQDPSVVEELIHVSVRSFLSKEVQDLAESESDVSEEYDVGAVGADHYREEEDETNMLDNREVNDFVGDNCSEGHADELREKIELFFKVFF